MRFTKMHGLGNDYLIVEECELPSADPEELERLSELTVAMSSRHFGVGSDGVILLQSSDTADVRMVIFNADGSRAETCGNGLRCVAKYVWERRDDSLGSNQVAIETDRGVRLADCAVRDGDVVKVTVSMGPPRFEPLIPQEVCGAERVVDYPFSVDGAEYVGTFVSIGNPHLVVFVDDLDRVDLMRVGPALENHELFPDRINVQFGRVASPSKLIVQTWERGSGRTLACGTGACAASAVAESRGLVKYPVRVQLPGGCLEVCRESDSVMGEGHDDVTDDYDELLLTGPAVEVFRGQWPKPGLKVLYD